MHRINVPSKNDWAPNRMAGGRRCFFSNKSNYLYSQLFCIFVQKSTKGGTYNTCNQTRSYNLSITINLLQKPIGEFDLRVRF